MHKVPRPPYTIISTSITHQGINHQKYYSGEFDIEWGDTITEDSHPFKKKEMEGFRTWLKSNNYDWEDPKLSLGYQMITYD